MRSYVQFNKLIVNTHTHTHTVVVTTDTSQGGFIHVALNYKYARAGMQGYKQFNKYTYIHTHQRDKLKQDRYGVTSRLLITDECCSAFDVLLMSADTFPLHSI